MKILHIITGLGVGGAEKALMKLVSTSTKSEISIISLTGIGIVGQELKEAGFDVSSINISILTFPFAIASLYRKIKKINPDIVQTWLYHADLIGGIIARAAGVRNIIWGVRTTELKKGAYVTTAVRKVLAYLSYYIPTIIVCVAEAAKYKHIELGYCEGKMLVIGNGFDICQLQHRATERSQFRKIHQLHTDHVVIGSVGRFSQDKGQDLFIKAASKVASNNPKVRFLMVGKELNRNNKELMGWIEAADLSDKVILLGERKDVNTCLSAMDVFCLHSRSEGFPNVLGEAMSMAVPCVAADVGDVAVVLADTGILVKKNNYDSIADGLIQMLKKKQEQRHILGQKAMVRISAEYSLDVVHGKYEDLYVELLNKGKY